MLSILTPDGSKNLILRGIMTETGPKGIAQVSVTDPAGDYQVWDGTLAGLTVAVDDPYVQGSQASDSAVTINTGLTTAVASGGSPPYTYAWTLEDDGGFAGWSINNPAGAQTSFRGTGVNSGEAWTGEFRCTVTDARGATGTADVTATVRNYGGLL